MTTDYIARKRAKKRSKEQRSEASAEASERLGDGPIRRVRKKRGPNHRIRKGACFRPPPLPPALAAEDAAAAAAAKRAKAGLVPRRVRKRLRREAAAAAGDGGGSGSESDGSEGEGEEESEDEPPPPAKATKMKRPPAATAAPPLAPASASPPRSFAAALAALGHSAPTAVQRDVWAAALAGQDVLAVSPPGTGKTLAYLLPALHAAALAGGDAAGAGIPGAAEPSAAAPAPYALVILPARELTLQVYGAAKKARRPLAAGLPAGAAPASAAAVHGGVPLEVHAEALAQRSPAVLIGTPGRLRALVEADALRLSRCALLVLDEADKLLRDAACSADVAALREAMRAPAQALLLSATMPPAVAAAARSWMRSPALLGAAAANPAAAAATVPAALPAAPLAPAATAADGVGGAAVVAQEVQLCADHKKTRKLLRYMEQLTAGFAGARSRPRVLIFVNTAKAGAFVADLLRRHGHNPALLQGSAPQAARESALADFRCGKRPLLVATDVAGRGLHITGLERVVNWDFPPNLEAYCHRVGRAGRAGAPGHALSFFTRKMARMAPDLVALLRQAGQPVEKHLELLADVVAEAVAKGAELPADEDGEGEGEEAAGGEAEEDEAVPEPVKATGRKRAAEPANEVEEEVDDLRRKPLFGADAAPPRKAPKTAPKAPKAVVAAAEPKTVAAEQPPPEFIAAPRFAGVKPGYFFGKGRAGLGYHRDAKPKPSQLVLQKYYGGGGGGKRPGGQDKKQQGRR